MATKRPAPSARPADPEADWEVVKADYLATADEKYLKCRNFGHAWDPTHDGWLRPHSGEPWSKTLKCLRCGGERVLRATDGTFTNRYSMDEDYYVRGGHLSRLDVRLHDLQKAQAAKKSSPVRSTRTTRKRGS